MNFMKTLRISPREPRLLTNTKNHAILKMKTKQWEVFMKKTGIHIIVAMFATLASIITVTIMMLMRFMG